MLLLLLLLQKLSLSVTDAVIAIVLILDPRSFQNLDPKAGVHWIVAGKVAIRVAPANFVATAIGDVFKVAHSIAVFDPFAPSAPASANQGAPGKHAYF